MKRLPTTWNLAARCQERLKQDLSFTMLGHSLPGLSAEQNAEDRLIAAAQQGRREAFDALVRQYEQPLRHFLARRVGVEEAEDVLQETWIAGWTALPRYARQSRFKAWLFGIAAHKCADHFRSHSQKASETSFADIAEPGKEETAYAAIELKQVVQIVLAQLPPEQREVLELYYHAELTLAEIASALERNLNTVKYQFYRAHALAAKQLDSVQTMRSK